LELLLPTNNAPKVVSNPKETWLDEVNITVMGNVGSSIIVNDVDTGIDIGINHQAQISLDTSGEDGVKAFSIKFANIEGIYSEETTILISKIPEVYSITHNGTTYGIVTSPYTGKIWLDRNLGASQVCTANNDMSCYGDYYQWGRGYDGHQLSTSINNPTQAMDMYNAGADFIGMPDWLDMTIDENGTLRSQEWSRTDGLSICPIGYRVPTEMELRAETIDAGVMNEIDAFNSFLKLPSSGYRDTAGAINEEGMVSSYWTSSIDNNNRTVFGASRKTTKYNQYVSHFQDDVTVWINSRNQRQAEVETSAWWV